MALNLMGLDMGFTAGGAADGFFLGLKVLLFLGFCIFIAYMAGRMLLYNTKIVIIEKRGKRDQVIAFDTARLKKSKDGILKLSLAKSKKVLELPDYSYIHNIKWGFLAKSVVFYYRFGEESFTPVRIENILALDSVSLTPIEGDIAMMVNLIDELDAKFNYKDFWEKWGTLIVNLASFAILFLMLLFVVEGIKNASGSLSSVAQQFQAAAQSLSQCQVEQYVPGVTGS